jgi:hypothetical protein
MRTAIDPTTLIRHGPAWGSSRLGTVTSTSKTFKDGGSGKRLQRLVDASWLPFIGLKSSLKRVSGSQGLKWPANHSVSRWRDRDLAGLQGCRAAAIVQRSNFP